MEGKIRKWKLNSRLHYQTINIMNKSLFKASRQRPLAWSQRWQNQNWN